jgi:surface protein
VGRPVLFGLLWASRGEIVEMDCVTMVLVERQTGIPLDLIIFINSFLYEKLTDENFKLAIQLWFSKEKECKWRFGHIRYWNTSRVTNMENAFSNRKAFNEDISHWNVRNVTNMRTLFQNASSFNGNLSRWDVRNVQDMSGMFLGALVFNGDLGQWDVGNVTNMYAMFYVRSSI